MDNSENQLYPYAGTSRKSDYPLLSLPRNSIDPRYSQMMNPRLSNWNPGGYNQQNSELSVSRIESHPFDSSKTTQMVRSNAWGTETASNKKGMGEMTKESSEFSFSKLCAKMTPTKMLFFMVGFILCVIPLAVMTTLWINDRSASTASSTASSATGATSKPSVSTSVSLPIQCYGYSSLTDQFRNIGNGWPCCYSPYDTSSTLAAGWYRVSGSAGTQLVTSPVSTTSTCGGEYPGYFNGTLPSTAGEFTTGNVCFYTGVTCGYSLSPISAINCNGFYIFYLIPVVNSNYKYCTTN